MALEFHSDKPRYFQIQYDNSEESIIPFIELMKPVFDGIKVLEIGCGEGGVLAAFVDRGAIGFGVEKSGTRSHLAKDFLRQSITAGKARIVHSDITDISDQRLVSDLHREFDIIVLKDVIEHIDGKHELMTRMKDFLKPGGHIFVGFPPWHMPFGGHQQIAHSIIGRVPWIHLLPKTLWRRVLVWAGEQPDTVAELMDIRNTGISLERFRSISEGAGLRIVLSRLYFINPIFKFKFNLKPRTLWKIPAAIPVLRNFWTTCGYFLLQADEVDESLGLPEAEGSSADSVPCEEEDVF